MAQITKSAGKGAGIGAVIGTGVTGAASGALSAAGFSSGGVVAGSLAAGTQAGIGNVAAGSLFAVLQSVGATGVIVAALPYVAIGGAIIGGAVGGYSRFKSKKKI